MVKMAEEMSKHCGGLPLAIKVLGGLLAMQHTSREWERILRNIKSHIVGEISFNDYDNNSVYHVLSLSFEGLPVYLKQCLLYLASFPEDHEIDLEELSYIWVAEGIASSGNHDGDTIRDVSDVYIEELVKRNMVISERDIRTSRFETCRLHDVMREMCLLKAKEENFSQIYSAPTCSSTLHSQASSKSRRLVVHSSDTFHGEKETMNPKLRSLLCIKGRPREPSLLLPKLQRLRILDLSHAEFKEGKLPSSIGKLIHLRYLSLYEAGISHLPSSLGNLKLLLYLSLCVCTSPVYVPNVLKEMRELRYLYLPWKTHGKTKLELGNLVKLETLVNFSTNNCSVGDLQGMKQLVTLEIVFNGGCTLGYLSSTLAKLRHLEILSLDYKSDFVYTDSEGFVLGCVHLKNLWLSIYMPRLPDVQDMPSQLIIIGLEHCRLEEDPLPILKKLLHLKKVLLMSRSFCGRKMVCSAGGFPQLQMLQFIYLKEWEEWIVEDGSMPLLRSLTINSCKKLKELPDGLRFITSLKDLTFELMGEQWERRVSEAGEDYDKTGEDYDKVKHIPNVNFY